MTEQAAGKVADVTRQILDAGEEMLTREKKRMAQGVESVGDSIRDAADHFADGPLGGVEKYVAAVADKVAEASEYIAEKDIGEIRADAERIVRARPKLFIAGTLAAGIVLARFLKATEQPAGGEQVRTRSKRDAGERKRIGADEAKA